MPRTELLFQVASGCFTLVGATHCAVELVMGAKGPPEHARELVRQMQATKIALPGRQVPVYELMRGYSLMMGVVMIGLGVLGHLGAAALSSSTLASSSLALVSAVGLGLSLRFFFLLPTLAMAVASVASVAAALS